MSWHLPRIKHNFLFILSADYDTASKATPVSMKWKQTTSVFTLQNRDEIFLQIPNEIS